MTEDTAPVLVDEIDRKIIAELVNDGRASIRTVAERAHISRAHAYVRVQRLEDAGVIQGFTARIAYERAGLTASAYVVLTTEQESWHHLSAQLKQLPYVEHFALLGGDVDVLALVRAPDNTALRHLVLDRMQAIEGVLSTKTWLIFHESNGPGAQWVPDRFGGPSSQRML